MPDFFDRLPIPKGSIFGRLESMPSVYNPDDSMTATSGIDDIIESGEAPAFLQAEARLVTRLKAYKREAVRAKKEHTGNWESYIGLYRGTGHWPKGLPDYKVQATLNLILNLVERKTAMLTDSNPVLKVISLVGDGADPALKQKAELTAKALENVIQAIWQEHNIVQRLGRLLTYAQVFGSAGTNTGLDKLRCPGFLDPTIWVLDPRSVFFDPMVFTSEELYRGQYKVIETLLPTDMLRDEYSRFRDKIKASSGYQSDPEGLGPGGMRAKIRATLGFGEERVQAVDRTWCDEYWFADYAKDAQMRKLFPKGRHVIMTDNDVLCVDDDNPYIDGQDPIDYLDWHQDMDTIWGFGDVELYRSPQDLFNKIHALLIENATLMTNSIWQGDGNALTPEQWEELVNQPGLKVKQRPGSKLERQSPQPVSPALFNMIEQSMGLVEKLAGLGNVMSGDLPDRASGNAVNTIANMAQTTIRFKARQVESLLNRCGQKLISRIFQYTDPKRVWTLSSDAGQMLAFQFDKMKYKTDPQAAQQDFKFKIVPDSLLGQNKVQKGMQALQLHQTGIILNRKRVLDAFEWPDREAIEAEKVMIEQQRQQQQLLLAQAQALAGGMPGGPGGPGGGPPDRGGSPEGGGGRKPDKLPRPMVRGVEEMKPPGENDYMGKDSSGNGM